MLSSFRLSSLLDSIIPSAIPDADFKDGISAASSSSSPLSNVSIGSEVTDLDESCSSRLTTAEVEGIIYLKKR